MKKNLLALIILTFLMVGACTLVPQQSETPSDSGDQAESGAIAAGSGLSADAAAVAQERGLSPDDVTAALKTYMPTGVHDEYVIFASGGHGGQILVMGVPSMRLLKVVGVFTPEPWQGWGYGAGNAVLDEGNVNGKAVRWADTHHPALSETAGDYDGDFVFINHFPETTHIRIRRYTFKHYGRSSC